MYKLEVQPLREFEGGSRPTQYFSKGHHDKDNFLYSVEEECGDLGFDRYDLQNVQRYVRHEYWRKVPTSNPDTIDGSISVIITSKKGPGAFPVTVIDV